MRKKRDSKEYQCYVYSTTVYGLVGLMGLVSVIYFVLSRRYNLLLIALLVLYIASDNFFCAARAKKCGIPTESRYMVPPFLKKRS